MKNKIIFPFLIVGLFIAIIIIGILQYRSQRPKISETVPLIPAKPTLITTPRPESQITPIPGIAKTTSISAAIQGIPNEVSLAEKNKVFESFPLRVERFPTSSGIFTTINIYSFTYDPVSVIRLEVYGINYNNPELTGRDAIAFKESFLEAKKQLTSRGAVIKNLQIIFGNRQYIQDTATYWVKAFNLL